MTTPTTTVNSGTALTPAVVKRVQDDFHACVEEIDGKSKVSDEAFVAVLALTEGGEFMERLQASCKNRQPETFDALFAALTKIKAETLKSLETLLATDRLTVVPPLDADEVRQHVDTTFENIRAKARERLSYFRNDGALLKLTGSVH